jgi:hypothetical protein
MLDPILIANALCLVGISLGLRSLEDDTLFLANYKGLTESCEMREEDAFEGLTILAAAIGHITKILQGPIDAES